MLARDSLDPKKRAWCEAELATAPFPKELGYLWSAFNRLHKRRGSGFGAAPITWSDIGWFVKLTGTKLAPWEIEIIEELDALFLASQNTKIAKVDG